MSADAGTGAAPATSPTELLLRQIGARRDTARALAGRPAAQVERVIAQARARGDLRDRAAWVVSALRALPAEEPAAPPRVSDLAILTHPALTPSQRLGWLNRFRSADPFERPALLARFHQEHPPAAG